MRNPKDNTAYLHHICDAAENILTYIANHTFNNFAEDEWDQAAVIRNLEIIGEAANNIEPAFKEQYPDIPWRTMTNLRNVLVHDYADVDLNVVWQVISNDLTPLHKRVSEMLTTLS